MERIGSLSSPDLDWELLAQNVERAGQPVWLELGGVIRGVLLPSDAARRLLGQDVYARADRPINPRVPPDPPRDPALSG
ncbi:MAG TPA: hypothetical protein VFZ66_05890 [Herpetosiphonaceae bacterium]